MLHWGKKNPDDEETKDSDIMPFGKYKGEKIGDVPASYLLWFADSDLAKSWPMLAEYVEKNRKLLEKEKYSR
jgi:hypothetical protein